MKSVNTIDLSPRKLYKIKSLIIACFFCCVTALNAQVTFERVERLSNLYQSQINILERQVMIATFLCFFVCSCTLALALYFLYDKEINEFIQLKKMWIRTKVKALKNRFKL